MASDYSFGNTVYSNVSFYNTWLVSFIYGTGHIDTLEIIGLTPGHINLYFNFCPTRFYSCRFIFSIHLI